MVMADSVYVGTSDIIRSRPWWEVTADNTIELINAAIPYAVVVLFMIIIAHHYMIRKVRNVRNR